MCSRTGCCGSFIRIILGLVNCIFLIIGSSLIIIASVLRWSDESFIKKLSNDDAVQAALSLSSLNTVTIVLLSIGGFIFLLSLVGFIGAIFANRFFLVIYEIIVIVVFLTHGCALIVGAFKSSELETAFRKALNESMNEINTNSTSTAGVNSCNAMRLVSELFDCCGANSPQDFVNQSYIDVCCYKTYTDGCANKTIDVIKTDGIYIVVIPNSVMLIFEFLIVLLIPYLIGRIGREKLRRMEDEERIIQIQPTSYETTGYVYRKN